jgi:hypothetical protein
MNAGALTSISSLLGDVPTTEPNMVDRLHAVRMQRGHRVPIPLLQGKLKATQPKHPVSGMNASIDKPAQPRDSRAAALKGATARGIVEKQHMTKSQLRLQADQNKKLQQDADRKAAEVEEDRAIVERMITRRTGIHPQAERLVGRLSETEIRQLGGRDVVLRELSKEFADRPTSKSGFGTGRDTSAPTSGLQKQGQFEVVSHPDVSGMISAPLKSVFAKPLLSETEGQKLESKALSLELTRIKKLIPGDLSKSESALYTQMRKAMTDDEGQIVRSPEEAIQLLPEKNRERAIRQLDDLRLLAIASDGFTNTDSADVRSRVEELMSGTKGLTNPQRFMKIAETTDRDKLEGIVPKRILDIVEARQVEESERRAGIEQEQRIRGIKEAQSSIQEQFAQNIFGDDIQQLVKGVFDATSDTPKLVKSVIKFWLPTKDQYPAIPSVLLPNIEEYIKLLLRYRDKAEEVDKKAFTDEVHDAEVKINQTFSIFVSYVTELVRELEKLKVPISKATTIEQLEDIGAAMAEIRSKLDKDSVNDYIRGSEELANRVDTIYTAYNEKLEELSEEGKEGETEEGLSELEELLSKTPEIPASVESDEPKGIFEEDNPFGEVLLPTKEVPLTKVIEKQKELAGEGMVNDFINVLMRKAKTRSMKKREKLSQAVNSWLDKHPSMSVEDIPRGTVTKFINLIK